MCRIYKVGGIYMTTDLILLDEKAIKDKMYFIRGQNVMIDSDLAKIYGYSTKRFNEQVKNNIERFPEDFMFQLNDEEIIYLSRSNFSTSIQTKGVKGGRVYNPYAFTEQGIYMLMTVLKGEKAIKQSKSLIRIFKKMKDYLLDNNLLNMVLSHDNKLNYIDNEMKLLQKSIDDIKEKKKHNQIFFNGEYYDAYSSIIDIFKNCKKELIIIDSYADKYTLDLISRLKENVILITTNKLLKQIDIDNYNKQYNNLTIKYDNTFHDRYFILDKKLIYHCGTSLNYVGNKTFSINILEDKEIKELLLNKIKKLN